MKRSLLISRLHLFLSMMFAFDLLQSKLDRAANLGGRIVPIAARL